MPRWEVEPSLYLAWLMSGTWMEDTSDPLKVSNTGKPISFSGLWIWLWNNQAFHCRCIRNTLLLCLFFNCHRCLGGQLETSLPAPRGRLCFFLYIIWTSLILIPSISFGSNSEIHLFSQSSSQEFVLKFHDPSSQFSLRVTSSASWFLLCYSLQPTCHNNKNLLHTFWN